MAGLAVIQSGHPVETLRLGPLSIEILEDGSNTSNRFGSIIVIVPPKSRGPPEHEHVLHDETFLVTKGTMRFNSGDAFHDLKLGDYIIVPLHAPHTFENVSDEEARVFCTVTPAYYVNYFRDLAEATKDGKALTAEDNIRVMAKYATFPTGSGKK